MEIVAFTPAAALLLTTLAGQHALTEAEVCAVLRGLRTDHARGIIPVEAVERHVADVLIQIVTEALDARAVRHPVTA